MHQNKPWLSNAPDTARDVSVMGTAGAAKSHSWSAKQLTLCITRARKADDVLLLVANHFSALDHIHTTTCLHKLAKHWHSSCPEGLEQGTTNNFSALVHKHTTFMKQGKLNGRQLANTVWVFAMLNNTCQLGHGLVNDVTRSLSRRAQVLNHQDVANSLWALAILQEDDSSALATLTSCRSIRQPTGFKAQEISNSIWAMAIFSWGGMQQNASCLAVEALRTHQQLEPQHVANITWSIAKLSICINDFDPVADKIHHNLEQFKAQELSNISWALAAASVNHSIAPSQVAMSSLMCHRVREFKSQELTNIMWAFAESWPIIRFQPSRPNS